MFEEILSNYRKNQFKIVIDNVSESENDIKLLELKGLSALKIADYHCASKTFAKLVKLDTTPKNHFHEALANMALGYHQKAIDGFIRSQIDHKLKIPSRINQAACYIELDQYKEAVNILEKVKSRNPEIKETWFLLLKIYRKEKDKNKLTEILNSSKKYIGESLEWKRSQAYLYYFRKQYVLAIEYIIVKNITKIKDVASLLAKCYTKVSKFEKAATIYKRVLEEDISAINYYNLAATYSNLTDNFDLLKALEYANKSIEIDNRYHQSYYIKALVSEKINNPNQAMKEINLALELDSNNNIYLYKKAELLNLQGNQSESIKLLDRIIRIDKNNNIALRLKGIIELNQNNLKESAENLRSSINIDNKDQRAIAYYAINKLAQKIEVNEFLGIGTFVKEYKFTAEPAYENLECFNRDLEKDIKQHSLLRKEPNGLAARNGYLTDDLFADDKLSIKLFKKLLMEKINEYIDSLPLDMSHHMLRHKTNEFEISSWATWVKGDGFIDKHIHEESWISGAYYCKIPKITNKAKNNEGYFEYGCIPNDIKIPIIKERGYIEPTEGKLVIFPSYLYHQTIPHETDEDRISIAFDLTPTNWK